MYSPYIGFIEIAIYKEKCNIIQAFMIIYAWMMLHKIIRFFHQHHLTNKHYYSKKISTAFENRNNAKIKNITL